MLDTFFESILWPMVPPPAYGVFHILFTVTGFALCGFLAWLLRNTGSKVVGRVIFSCGLTLLVVEIFKQFFCYYAISDNAFLWSEFPFQLCSMPLYLCLLAPCLRPGKIQRAMYSFMVFYNLLGGAISFAEPSGIFQEHLFLTAHSCLWHMLLVFIGLLLYMSKLGGQTKNDYKTATYTFLVLCAVAFVFNCAVQFGLGKHMNMFFVGPGNSPLIVFKQISQYFGWYVSTPIYIVAVCLGAYIIFCVTHRISHKTFPFQRGKAAAK